MDPDPDATNGQSSSQALPIASVAPALVGDSMGQIAGLLAHLLEGAQSKMSGAKPEEGDRHLPLFLRLKPPRFKGAVDPQEAEDWLMRLEKCFDSMMCPESRKVSLAAFLLDGEAERWWLGQQQEKFGGLQNAEISWEQFSGTFREWFVPPSARQRMQESFLRLVQGGKTVMQYEAEFTALARYAPQLVSTPEDRCYRFLSGLRDSLRHPLVPFRILVFSELVERARLIENDLVSTQRRWDASRKRSGGESSRGGFSGKKSWFAPTDSGRSAVPVISGSAGSSAFVGRVPVCASYSRRHSSRCYGSPVRCFRCDQLGHRIAECPQRVQEGDQMEVGVDSSLVGRQG